MKGWSIASSIIGPLESSSKGANSVRTRLHWVRSRDNFSRALIAKHFLDQGMVRQSWYSFRPAWVSAALSRTNVSQTER